MPADRYAFGDQYAAARTGLAGERRIHCDDSPPGACRLEGEDDEERAPSRVSHRLGQLVMLDHGGGLEILMLDAVVLLDERERGLMVKVGALALHVLLRQGAAG
jgi:hypothetical protein